MFIHLANCGFDGSHCGVQAYKSNKAGGSLVLVTTPAYMLAYQHAITGVKWGCVIVDEAHSIKSVEAQLHQAVAELHCSFKVSFAAWYLFFVCIHLLFRKVLLTGTPVQNNLAELYALLSVVAPTVFPSDEVGVFTHTYRAISNSVVDASIQPGAALGLRTNLTQLLQTFLLRRMKHDVEGSVPGRSEVLLFAELTPLQHFYYKAILMKNIDAFADPVARRLANILMQLRKCVNHPYLFDGVEPEPFEMGEHLVRASAKMILLDQLLAHLIKHKHKVLIFSQMTRMLDIVQDYLAFRNYTYERLDGSVRGEERFQAVNNFSTNAETFVFLLSTRAGGVGLNLVCSAAWTTFLMRG
jgi:SNF2 family DNA or RNA helicase